MSDQAESGDNRPVSCVADLAGDYPHCAKCGIAWSRKSGAPSPPCEVMTLTRMEKFMLAEISRAEASHGATLAMLADDERADPLPSMVRAAGLKSVLRLIDRLKRDERILDILNPWRARAS